MEILKFEEAEASTYPTLAVLDEDGGTEQVNVVPHVWRRLEEHIAHRWTPRQCVWTVQGPGEWFPHLKPLSNVSVDVWDETSFTWSSLIADATAIGGLKLPNEKTYRVTATVGDTADPVPQIVAAAYQRLEEYLIEAGLVAEEAVGSSAYSLKIGDGIDDTITRSPNFIAKALQYSGAGDLLRGFRRV